MFLFYLRIIIHICPTLVKIRNSHSSCTLSIFERQCHRQSKVLLHWCDVLSLYQSNRGAPTKPLSHFLKFPHLHFLANLCRIPCMYLLVHLTVSSMMSISMVFRHASSSVDASLAWDVGPGSFFHNILSSGLSPWSNLCFPPSCLFVSVYIEIAIIVVSFVIFTKFLIFRNVRFALAIMISIVHIHTQISVTFNLVSCGFVIGRDLYKSL